MSTPSEAEAGSWVDTTDRRSASWVKSSARSGSTEKRLSVRTITLQPEHIHVQGESSFGLLSPGQQALSGSSQVESLSLVGSEWQQQS